MAEDRIIWNEATEAQKREARRGQSSPGGDAAPHLPSALPQVKQAIDDLTDQDIHWKKAADALEVVKAAAKSRTLYMRDELLVDLAPLLVRRACPRNSRKRFTFRSLRRAGNWPRRVRRGLRLQGAALASLSGRHPHRPPPHRPALPSRPIGM